MTKPVIGVFAEPPASIGSLIISLPEIFPQYEIRRYLSNDLEHKGIERDLDMFIIPGISGERSLYAQQISQAAAAQINARVMDGLSLVLICAGAYFGAQSCSYARDGNTVTPAWQASFHDAHTVGPIEGYALKPEEGDRYSDLRVVPVRYKGADRKESLAHICYGNGPRFYVDEANPRISVYARFEELPGQPPAVFFQSRGKGLVTPMAAHPEIGFQEISEEIVRKEPDAARIKRLCDELQPYEPGRQAFLAGLARIWEQHMASVRLSRTFTPFAPEI